MFVYILEMESSGFLILTLPGTWIKEDLLSDMFSLLVVVLLVGKPPYRLMLLYPLPRLNTWLLKRLYG